MTIETDTPARLRVVIAKLSRRLRPAGGLTPTTTAVLFTIVRLGPLRISELAELEGLNPTMLSRVIADLVAQELVSRVKDPEDRRAGLVEATPAGVALRARITAERNDALRRELAALPAADRDALERALPVLEALNERLKAARP